MNRLPDQATIHLLGDSGPTGAVQQHQSQRSGGSLFVQSHGVGRRNIIFHPEHGFFQIGHNFIASDHNNNPAGSECQRRDAVADHIQIHQLAGFSDGIRSGDKQIGMQCLPSALFFLIIGDLFVERIPDLEIRLTFQLFVKARSGEGHRTAPGYGPRF